MTPLPDKKYSVIYADPPWEYAKKAGQTASAAWLERIMTQ